MTHVNRRTPLSQQKECSHNDISAISQSTPTPRSGWLPGPVFQFTAAPLELASTLALRQTNWKI